MPRRSGGWLLTCRVAGEGRGQGNGRQLFGQAGAGGGLHACADHLVELGLDSGVGGGVKVWEVDDEGVEGCLSRPEDVCAGVCLPAAASVAASPRGPQR